MKRQMLFIGVVALAALLLGFGLDPGGYPVRVVCLILFSACLAQSWNIVGGLANQISLGHAAFFGIGAYTSTVLQIRYGASPWIGIWAGMLLAALASLLISLPTLRLRGPYFALATLAFGECCRIVANSATAITGGPQGLSIPFLGQSLSMMQFKGAGSYIPLFTGLFVIVFGAFALLSSGRSGYLLRALRENEDAAEVAGVDTLSVKIRGALLSACLTAACGTLFAQFSFFIDPDSVFNGTSVSVRAALIAIVGGIGSLAGPLVGAIFVVLLEEVLNTYLSSGAAGVGPLIFGVILIAVVLARPGGLLSLVKLPKLVRRVTAKALT
jgi:branched-chain amino acid transport system permease protein